MSAETEKTMLEAIAAHYADEGHEYGRLRAVAMMVLAEDMNDSDRVGRAWYSRAESYEAAIIVNAPKSASFTEAPEPPQVFSYGLGENVHAWS